MKKQFDDDKKLVMYGSKGHIQQAEAVFNKFLSPQVKIEKTPEANIRLLIAYLIEEHCINNVDILYNGNTVWNKKKILAAIKTVMRCGMERMTDYLYKFLSLSCGSIAHYNKQGWIAEYPTIQSLKMFFCRNEFGKRVLDSIPVWQPECRDIVFQIEKLLKI